MIVVCIIRNDALHSYWLNEFENVGVVSDDRGRSPTY